MKNVFFGICSKIFSTWQKIFFNVKVHLHEILWFKTGLDERTHFISHSTYLILVLNSSKYSNLRPFLEFGPKKIQFCFAYLVIRAVVCIPRLWYSIKFCSTYSANTHSANLFENIRQSANFARVHSFIRCIQQRRTVSLFIRIFGEGASFAPVYRNKPNNSDNFFSLTDSCIL
jgi:hypothetical protein